VDSAARTFTRWHLVSGVFRGAFLACHCDMGVCRSTAQRRLLGAGSLLAASLATACGSVQSKERSESPDLATKLLSDAATTAESVVTAVSESLGVPATEPAPPTPVPAVDEPPVRRPRPAPAAKAPARAAEVAPVVTAVVEIPAADPALASIEEPVEEPGVVEPLDYTVYSSADADVVPPTPPVASGIRPWRVKAGPSVEVTVASDGTVEKVRVLGATRMSDAMVLSHVKAWKFAPALRAGDPVRYRLLLDDPVVAP
jgi:outer membrane biosynthesis protein TonB